ncbi:MAG: hypothetical protein HFF17_07625 [Oscillospiraceae bacterium]|nr:hypothetical protein [Oscillospiraceae bacterium]
MKHSACFLRYDNAVIMECFEGLEHRCFLQRRFDESLHNSVWLSFLPAHAASRSRCALIRWKSSSYQYL